MKIALVMAGNEDGGLEKHVMDLANGLAARGHDVQCVAHARYADGLSSAVQHVRLNLAGSRWNLWLLLQLIWVIRKNAPDIAHAHGGKAIAMMGLITRFLPMPWVATVHGFKRRYRGLNQAARVIAVSRALQAQTAHPHVECIYSGVVVPIVSSPTERDASERPRFLAVGRLVDVKGFDVLLNAWPQNADLLIAGEGSERPALAHLIAELGLQSRVQLLGQRRDVPALMAQCDGVVISSWKEGGPYVLGEALCAGKPVLSTRVGLVPEWVPEQWLCEPGDRQALKALITRASLNLSAWREDFQSAFSRAQIEFDPACQFSKTEQCYLSAIHFAKANFKAE